jgi:hypothetical protein
MLVVDAQLVSGDLGDALHLSGVGDLDVGQHW